MKKVALMFVVAVLAPSLVLAWLAVRSLRDQQFLLERQQSLLDQHVTDTAAQSIADYLARQQQEFGAQVEDLAAGPGPQGLAVQFDDRIRERWPLAEVGFCVTAAGKILSPPPNGRPAAQMFRLDNAGFLANREPVEVYLTAGNSRNQEAGNGNVDGMLNPNSVQSGASPPVLGNSSAYPLAPTAEIGTPAAATEATSEPVTTERSATRQAIALGGAVEPAAVNSAAGQYANNFRNAFVIPGNNQSIGGQGVGNSVGNGANRQAGAAAMAKRPSILLVNKAGGQTARSENGEKSAMLDGANQNALNYKGAESRKVNPQSQVYAVEDNAKRQAGKDGADNNLSRVVPAEAEFRQLIGDQTDGMLARFLQNKLKLMCWHRLKGEPDLIFGAQLNLDRVVAGVKGVVLQAASPGSDICLAVLDDNARPVVLSRAGFQAAWKRPFVATEIGDALPHWEVAVYLLDPAQLTQAAHTARLTLGLLIAVLVVAIGIGCLLMVRSLNAELKLARQKTDFVSNVSHELKTPLTSIRMFSELLAEGRVADPDRRRSYLHIITAEAARLTRLINNVLDFSRMERGEKKYNFQGCDLTEVVRGAAETYRPHLESAGFKFACDLPAKGIALQADADALSQVIVNLLSNAEKYSGLGERRPVGGSELTASRPGDGGSAKEISLVLSEKQSPVPYAEVRILDRGPGVPRGSEEKIFEKFYRAHDSLSSGIQGSGLGLTIARQIARAHGGDVVYEPRPGGGSCFSLRLPVKPGAANERESAPD
jgi:signal transduction histidine kinase